MSNDTSRNIDQIEADIARSREDIDSTLNELQSRFTPGQLMDQGLHYLRHSGGSEFISNFGATVKYNPVPVALAGIGIAWLMASGHRSPPPAGSDYASTGAGSSLGNLGERSQDALHRASDAASSLKTRLSDTAHASRDKLSSATSSARESAARISQGVSSAAHRARDGYQSMLHDQPLLLGAIGLALGAAFAAALPRTRTEDRLMGDASDRLSEEAKRAGEEQLQKAERIASSAADAAREEARRTSSSGGATPQGTAPGTPAAIDRRESNWGSGPGSQTMQSVSTDEKLQPGMGPF